MTSWNEEMIDNHFLDHGKDCLKAAEICRTCAEALRDSDVWFQHNGDSNAS